MNEKEKKKQNDEIKGETPTSREEEKGNKILIAKALKWLFENTRSKAEHSEQFRGGEGRVQQKPILTDVLKLR